MSIHYARDVRNGVHHEAPEGWTAEEWHQAATSDTGTSHNVPGRLYVVQCEWCPDAFAANTRGAAMELFREHEDAMLASHSRAGKDGSF